ncbi:hypothetical protein KFL_003340070 [Klebsormidium nitens]|uniref:Uncharacterized protein n=1 Tax=Klebsormidium nitens TaxID=105231 RepID=A0A1Y1I9B3_KLENI|nr:hypothetical protein KFL_003340070 [Klebsormidium nitens]|eukprot:GAQ87143.1 hypothetical protein KFL_003340070 [Klebsormidium nitens]
MPRKGKLRRAKSDYTRQCAGLVEPLKNCWISLLRPKQEDVIFDCSPGDVLKRPGCNNGLLAAFEKAYSGHLHLHLRPDDVWLTICQGVSRHLQHGENAEKYRRVFVDHDGQEEIAVNVNVSFLPGDSRLLDWPKCVALITQKLDKKVKAGAGQLLTNDFSTTDVISKTAWPL